MSAKIFRSDWINDNNSTNHETVIPHNLGEIPDTIVVYFIDQVGVGNTTVINWSWQPQWSGNPVGIEVNKDAVILNISNGSPLHGTWNPDNAQWATYTSGYWKVIAAILD